MDSTSNPVGAAKGAPQTLLSVPDGVFLVAGMVIGVGISSIRAAAIRRREFVR